MSDVTIINLDQTIAAIQEAEPLLYQTRITLVIIFCVFTLFITVGYTIGDTPWKRNVSLFLTIAVNAGLLYAAVHLPGETFGRDTIYTLQEKQDQIQGASVSEGEVMILFEDGTSLACMGWEIWEIPSEENRIILNAKERVILHEHP